MSADKLKWRINRAVRTSNLPSSAKLIMLTLSDRANVDTAAIPENNSPSLKELAGETSLNKATVTRYLPELERLGWIARELPSAGAQARHDRTGYQLSIGREARPGDFETAKSGSRGATPAESHSATSPELRDATPKGGSEVSPGLHHATTGVAPRDLSESRDATPYLKDDDLDDQNDPFFGPTADAAAPPTNRKPRTKTPKNEAAPRADVEALCARLAELMIRNECKPPTISQNWRDETRRLLDLDKRDFDKAMALLEWSQNDEFWQAHIHSMPKFREKYDTLRQQANAQWKRERERTVPQPRNGHVPYQGREGAPADIYSRSSL